MCSQGLLTETLCSLKGNVDRFAFSTTWEMTPDAKIVKEDFFRSIIHSKRAMTYAQAQALLDDPNAKGDVAQGVKDLAVVARILRKRRVAAGALTLASPEVRFELDSETHDPLDVAAYTIRETNHLVRGWVVAVHARHCVYGALPPARLTYVARAEQVEEFMLLANITVARRITKAFPMFACLRRHPQPSRQQFDQLLAAAASVGVKLDVSSSKALADSLDAAILPDNPHFNKLLRILTTRCMTQAVYVVAGGGCAGVRLGVCSLTRGCSVVVSRYFGSGEYAPAEYLHYGLATPIYTHFTSPIRRYVGRQRACACDTTRRRSLTGLYAAWQVCGCDCPPTVGCRDRHLASAQGVRGQGRYACPVRQHEPTPPHVAARWPRVCRPAHRHLLQGSAALLPLPRCGAVRCG